jgi:hypothetical protein
VLFFVLGAGSVLLLKRSPVPSIPQGWIDVKPADTAVLFDMTAMNVDITPPTPGKIEGRIKFLQ